MQMTDPNHAQVLEHLTKLLRLEDSLQLTESVFTTVQKVVTITRHLNKVCGDIAVFGWNRGTSAQSDNLCIRSRPFRALGVKHLLERRLGDTLANDFHPLLYRTWNLMQGLCRIEAGHHLVRVKAEIGLHVDDETRFDGLKGRLLPGCDCRC